MPEDHRGRTLQDATWYDILTSPFLALGLFLFYLGIRNADKWGEVDEKAEQAKQRSKSIDDWSEVVNNDDWR